MLNDFEDKVEQARFRESVEKLKRDNGFQQVLKWMTMNLYRIDMDARWQSEERIIRQYQGQAQMLEMILKEFE